MVDPTTKSIMTKANEEMTNILTYDKDLIFLETKIEINLTKRKETIMTLDPSNGLLSTGSVSQFRTTAMTKTKATHRSTHKSAYPSTTAGTFASNQDLLMTVTTISE